MTITKRDNKLDYLKALAIGLVVWGHILDNCIKGEADYHLRGIINFTHIPLFLVISGTLVKDKPLNVVFFKNILKRFVLPYTVWTILLTTFYQGTTHLLYDGLSRNIEVYCSNWAHSFLWFIKAYVIVYLLWSVLYKLSLGFRVLVSSLILFLLNIVFISHDILSELLSLSLYSYVFFASGAFLRSYFPRLKRIHLYCIFFLFLACLPYATLSNSYFNASFRVLYESGNWYIFLVRFVAGLAISIFLINIKISKYNLHIGGGKNFLLRIGQRTLQIYMLQSLLVEALLPRLIHFENTLFGYAEASELAVVMTLICFLVIEYTSKIKIIKTLLWGM